MFVQIGMEAAVTPLTKVYFDWDEVNNSIYYAGQGLLVRVLPFPYLDICNLQILRAHGVLVQITLFLKRSTFFG